jgi:hypothetical protein
MSAAYDNEPLDSSPGAVSISDARSARPVAIATSRFSRGEEVLGILALVSFVLVFIRLFERWRVTPRAVSHRVAIPGTEIRSRTSPQSSCLASRC